MRPRRWQSGAWTSLIVGLVLGWPPATPAQTLQSALLDGRPSLDGRYRFENVDQVGFAREAKASTLRTRLGYETRAYHGLFLFVEAENISAIGNEAYDDTIDGRLQFPVVADPETTEINQALLTINRVPRTTLRLGRQRIILDNERFVCAAGFRQNEQTFDAGFIENRSLPDTVAKYIYLDNVNRVFGDDSPLGDFESESHLVNLAYEGWRLGRLSVYGYLIELDDAQAFSSTTFGARFVGDRRFRFNRDLGVVYAIEFAHQRDRAGNPGDYAESYVLVEPGVIVGDLVARLGFERLGGDAANSFQTPLATLRAFNGATDKFLVTPAAGLEDRYVEITYTFGRLSPLGVLSLSGAYHDFRSDRGDLDFGSEWSAKVDMQLTSSFSLSLEYADFDAGLVSSDTEITWSTLAFRF